MDHDELLDAHRFSRREFLQRTSRTLAGAAAAVTLGAESLEAATDTVPQFRRLGRTRLRVTTISFGGILISDRRVLDVAIDHGINLVHTSPGYRGGASIAAFGEVMKTKRDKVILALKAPPHEVDSALKILNTDHADILVPNYEVNGPPFPNDELRQALDALKKAGKIRFTGFATHSKQASTMSAAVETGYFDVMIVAYNVTNRATLDPILREAKRKRNMGFMVMKSAGGLDTTNPEVFAAGLKSLLANRDVDTLTIGMGTYQHVQQNAAIMGQRLTRREQALLDAHLHRTLASACTLCGDCTGVCPRGIRVADVMRCEHYAERGDLDLARETYFSLPAAATATSCTGCGSCTLACPKRLNVAERVQRVHSLLA